MHSRMTNTKKYMRKKNIVPSVWNWYLFWYIAIMCFWDNIITFVACMANLEEQKTTMNPNDNQRWPSLLVNHRLKWCHRQNACMTFPRAPIFIFACMYLFMYFPPFHAFVFLFGFLPGKISGGQSSVAAMDLRNHGCQSSGKWSHWPKRLRKLIDKDSDRCFYVL